MSLKEDLLQYTDKNGLISNLKNPDPQFDGSQNGPLFTSEALVVNFLQQPEGDAELFFKYLDPIKGCITDQNMLQRSPGNKEQEGPDDYIGFFAMCYLYKLQFTAKMVMDAMIENNGFLQNEPDKNRSSAFFYRFPALVYIGLCAANMYRWYHFPLKLFTCLVILYDTFRTIKARETTPWILMWLTIQVAKRESKLCAWANKKWEKKLEEEYVGGMKAVFGIYFGSSHPIAKYTPIV